MSSAEGLFSIKDNLSNFEEGILNLNQELSGLLDYIKTSFDVFKNEIPLECRVVRRRPSKIVYDVKANSTELLEKEEEFGDPTFFYEPTKESLEAMRKFLYGFSVEKNNIEIKGLADRIKDYFIAYTKALDHYEMLGELKQSDEVKTLLDKSRVAAKKFIKQVNSKRLDSNLFVYTKNLDCADCELKLFEAPELIEGVNYLPFFNKRISLADKLQHYLTKGLIYAGRKILGKSKRASKWLDELELENNVLIDSFSPFHFDSEKNVLELYAKDLASEQSSDDIVFPMHFDERKAYPTCTDCFKTLKENYHFSIKDEVAYIFQLIAPRTMYADEYLRLRDKAPVPLVVSDDPHFQDSPYTAINSRHYAKELILAGQ